MAWDASPAAFSAMLGLAIVVALVPPALVWLGKRLVDLVATPGTTTDDIIPTVIALGLILAGQRSLGFLQNSREFLFSWRVRLHAEQRFLERAARADLGHFDNSDWHDKVQRATRDLNFRPGQLVRSVIGLTGSLVTLLGMLGILLTLHPLLVVVAVGSVIPGMAIQRRITKRLYQFWWSHTAEEREQFYLRGLLSEARTAKELRSFALASYLQGRYDDLALSRFARMRRLYLLFERFQLLTGLLTGGAMALAYWFVATRALAGELTVGDITAVTGAVTSVTGTILGITQSFVQIEEHATFLDDYFEFLALDPLLPTPESPRHLPARLDAGIEFDDVTFTYPGGTETALAGCSLKIEPGELVALVGDNGAGKTSMVKLLLRFYDPQQGAVRVGGVDLREIDPDELRSRMGVLFQDFAQYELSARENVSFGRVQREPTDDAVMAALEAARAARMVKGLRDGIDTKVGRLFEGGHDLSGGEWQRLALARLMFRGADIWILDEPTSALDPEAEAAIFAELRENLRGRMGIVISHRFSTVRIADRIAVVADGRVTELGTHQELLAQGGRYAHLFELQAAGYR